jgi:hypothetical protein
VRPVTGIEVPSAGPAGLNDTKVGKNEPDRAYVIARFSYRCGRRLAGAPEL